MYHVIDLYSGWFDLKQYHEDSVNRRLQSKQKEENPDENAENLKENEENEEQSDTLTNAKRQKTEVTVT
jgi:hypothetical protein